MQNSPDAVCQDYEGKATITIRALDDDQDTILIEADRDGLEFLGNLFLAQARASDCGFQFGPASAGRALFSSHSTKGLYIHRLHSEPKS
jgi:hypothetical protein